MRPLANVTSLAELGTAVRERRISAVDLVTTSLERIERANTTLNAVTATFAEGALEDARRIDEEGHDGPLAGLPLLVKDTTDVEGLVTNFGSRSMRSRPPARRTDIAVERLLAAGAVVVGRTNVPEFAFQGWTGNDLFGDTGNPWALEWSPGGSSGGSGAALAAGLAPLATGTDGGGSIRTPAVFCGLVGLKPTAGAIGRRPIPSWLEVSTHGPMAHSIADARLLFEIMRGPVAGDPTAAPMWRSSSGAVAHMGWGDRPDEMPRRVIAVERTWDFGPLPSNVRDAFRAALDAIDRDLGIPVEGISVEDLWPTARANGGEPGADWFTMVIVEEVAWLGRPWVEEHLEEFSEAFRFEMQRALRTSLDSYMATRLRRFDYTLDLDELLGHDAVLVCPAHGYAGWLADGTLPDTGTFPGGEAYNTGEFNLSGHPSLALPAGMTDVGVPFGFLVNGPRWRDDLVLAFGEAWERANPWPAVAPGFEPFGV